MDSLAESSELFSLKNVLTGLSDTVQTLLENMVLTLLVVDAVLVVGETVTDAVVFTGCSPEPEGGRLATIIAVLGVT